MEELEGVSIDTVQKSSVLKLIYFRFTGMWYPTIGPLAEVFVPIARLMREYGYCTQFIERKPGRYLDIYSIADTTSYDELWSEVETSCLEESLYDPEEE